MPDSQYLDSYHLQTQELEALVEIDDADVEVGEIVVYDTEDDGIEKFKTAGALLSLFSQSILGAGDSDPDDSDIVENRTKLYLHTGTQSIWISVDGGAWVEYAYDEIILQYAETNSTSDSDWHTTKTDDDNYLRLVIGQTTTPGIPLGTVLRGGEGVTIDDSGNINIDDDYVDALIEGADVYLEHFRLPYTSSFFNTSEARWGSGANSDPDIDYTIYMQPTTAHREIVSELIGGARMQVREVNGSVRNTFTLIADVIGPDSSGVFTLNGSFDNEPAPFVSGTNYGLYFSQSRPHSVRTGDTISGDGNATPLEVADDSLTDQHISDSLDASEQTEARERLGIEDNIAWGGQIAINHVAIDNIGSGSNARWALQASGLNHFLRFEDLSRRDQDYVESLLIGAKIGFYDGDTEAERATLASTWNSTNQRLRITFDTAGALSSSIDYDLRITQYRPEHGIPPGGDDDQVLKKRSGADYDADWEDDEGDISIENEGTEVQAAADTLNFTGDGVTVTEENSGVEVNIPVGSIWVEHFTSTFRSSFFTTTGDRWGAANQSDGSGHIFIIHPNDAHIPIIEALRNGSRVQVRNTDDTIQNEFTLEEDAPDPDSTGNYQLRGDFDRGLNFANNTAYRLYFSESRRHEEIESRPAVQDEGTEVDANPEHLDFTGAGVTVTQDGEGVEIAIPGGDGEGSTDLDIANRGANTLDITSSSGDDVTIPRATTSASGLMGAIDKLRVDIAPFFVPSDNVSQSANGNDITLLLTSVSETVGISFRFELEADNTGAMRLQLGNNGTFWDLLHVDGSPFAAGDLRDGEMLDATFNGTNYISQILPLREPADVSVRDEHVADDLNTTEEDNFRGKIGAAREISVEDDGTEVQADPDKLNFTGSGVTVIVDDNGAEVAIPGGGGGDGAAQRSESITFQVGPEEIENDGVVISPATSNAVDVTFPSTGGGNPEILDPGSDADGFVVLQRGIYYLTVRGLVVAVTARCTGQFRIYEYDADITTALPIGRTQNTYIRYQHTNAQPLFEDGILEIAEDNTAVKLVAISALPDAGQPGNDNSRWTLNAGLILKLYRTGIKGEPGDGVLDEISEADITDEDSSTVGGISGRRARAAVDAFADSVDTFHLTVDRNYITGTPNAANDITIVLQSGDVYDVGISRYTGAEALPETYLNALPVNTEIRLASGDTVWDGELQEIVTETDTSATLRIDFGDRTGTFTANDTVAVSFGYAPARVPRADEIEVEGDLDGTLFDADDDLESIIQSIDNFDLSGDVVDAGDDITIAGTGTETDPKVISNDAPFTDYDSDLLGELANTARHTVEDDLVLRLQYGAEHLFGGHDRVITGLTSIDGHIFAGSDEGFVNDERGINTEDLYDLTTNNNHPETAGNWYFGRESEILIRERNASGVWSNASPDEFATGIASGDGIGIGVDPENLTVLYFLHEQGDGIRIQSLGVAIFPSSGVITTEANHDITRASINSILTANDLQNISEIRDTNGNIGVTAMGARDDIVYFAVTGIEDDEHGIPSTVILRINTSGSGSSRTFTLDTEYVRKIGIRQNVQGLVPTATGFWIATEHVVYEYHESGYSLPEPGPDSDEHVVVYDEDTDSYILRTREGLPATVSVDTAFFAGDGATATPITLKSDITQANQETFRERIGVQRPAVAIFWGRNQTDRTVPQRDTPYDFGETTILRFKGSSPDEHHFGGDNLGDIMVSGTIPNFVETNIDNTADFSVDNNEVFQLPEGLWSIRLYLASQAPSSGRVSIQMKQVLSGIDDRIVPARPGFTYATSALEQQGPTIFASLEHLYFETDGMEYFYFTYHGFDDEVVNRTIAFYLILENL